MADEPSSDAELMRLSEDSAHRLLARAIELDDTRGSETTLAELRGVANEAGISSHAFDAALREFDTMAATFRATNTVSSSVEPSSVVSRLWRRLRGADTRPEAVGDAVVSNAIAITLFWLLTFLLTRIAIGIGWQAMEGATLIGCMVGVGIARRLRARLVEVGLMGFVAFQAAELVMHLSFGLKSVQGEPTHFAVIVAGVLGAAIGWTANRRPGAMEGRMSAAEAMGSTPVTDPGFAGRADDSPRLQTLRLPMFSRGNWLGASDRAPAS
jgi:hypothetical protein